jgi:hypothetical protein
MDHTSVRDSYVLYVNQGTFSTHASTHGPIGIPVPDRFSHAEQFIRTLESGGLVVQSIAGSTLGAFFGGPG